MNSYKEIIKNSKQKGILLDYCNSDEKYYYNGIYIDLCGLPVNDYINSTLLKCNNSGENDTPTNKKKNTLIFTYNDDGYLIAYFQFIPKIDLTVKCTCENNEIVFNFNSGSNNKINSNYKLQNLYNIVINNVNIMPSEDETYTYGTFNIVNKQKEDIVNVYNLNALLNFNDIDNASNTVISDMTKTIIKNDDTITINYTRPADDTSNVGDDEYDEWVKNNSYITPIIIEKEAFDNNLVTIYNALQMELNNSLYEIDTIVIDGKTYSILTEFVENVTTEQTMMYNGVNIITHSGDSNINIIYNIKNNN